jgi:hypothetical protein
MCMVVSPDEDSFLVIKSWDRNDKGQKLHPPELGDQPERHTGKISDVFDSVRVHAPTAPAAELTDVAAIVDAGLNMQRLVSHTVIPLADGGSVLMQYPVKVCNFSERDHYYQTDTGPILWPDPANNSSSGSASGVTISTMRLAFIAHNAPHWAEMIVSAPTPLLTSQGQPYTPAVSVNHYSRAVRLDGVTNRVFAI